MRNMTSTHRQYLLGLIGFTGVFVITAAIAVFLEAWAGIVAAIEIHKDLAKAVFNAPLWFFDSASMGQILNRFSADVGTIDVNLVKRMSMVFGACIYLILMILVLVWRTPWLAVLVPIISWATYGFIYSYYRHTIRELRRCYLISNTPLNSHYSEALSGSAVIRAFRAQASFEAENINKVAQLMRVRFLEIGCSSWTNVRMQMLTFPIILMNMLLPRVEDDAVNAGYAGLALSYSLRIAGSVASVMALFASLEREFCSVERTRDYVECVEESPEKVQETVDAAPVGFSMPHKHTGVSFLDVSVKYRRVKIAAARKDTPGGTEDILQLPYALRRINARAGPSDRIGIVGRTGSGKSTLLLSLLNLVHCSEGLICIDGVSIKDIPDYLLHKLVGIFPQFPLILHGWTVQDFLDPLKEHPEMALWDSLSKIGMKELVMHLPQGLHTVVVPDEVLEIPTGKRTKKRRKSSAKIARKECPLSDSQLNYLSLARLVLNADQYRVVVVDEPPPEEGGPQTHTVQHFTPFHVVLRDYFSHCTVFVVAHHFASLALCDRIWLLASGQFVAECLPSEVSSQKALAQKLEQFSLIED